MFSISTTNPYIVFLLIITIVLLPTFLIIIIATVVRRIHTSRLRKKEDTIITYYEPPHHLSPAEIGYIYDMKCGMKEVHATLLDLEARGIIKVINLNHIVVVGLITDNSHLTPAIELLQPDIFFNLPDFEQVALNIALHEQILPRRIVSIDNPSQNPPLNLLAGTPTMGNLANFTAAIRRSLKDKGYTVRSYFISLLKRSIIFILFVTAWPVIFFGTLILLSGDIAAFFTQLPSIILMSLFFAFFLFPIYAGVGMLLLAFWAKIAGRYWLYSKPVRAIWRDIEGYRIYIKTVELKRLQSEQALDFPSKDARALFPYAIAFNLMTVEPKR